MKVESHAIGKRLPVSELKARLIVDNVRGMGAERAISYLEHFPNKSARYISKIISSAVANLTVKVAAGKKIDEEKLLIEKITVDKGPVRSMRRARTRARYKKKKFRSPLCRRPSCNISVYITGEELESKSDK
ncbi:MAG: 50S ribosomal protein L22 [Candidatus Coatesbacteria bacterium]|nr:50S ribosomal protein L22 [Candidatus Coatesbacteria bacterium]